MIAQQASLLLVIAFVITLTLLGRWLTQLTLKPKAAAAWPSRGVALLPGIDIAGPQQRRVDELRSLIRRGRIEPLTGFIAYYRPALVQLDLYLANVRERYHQALDRSAGQAAPDTTQLFAALDLRGGPAGLDLSRLSTDELTRLLESEWKEDTAITRKLVERFGGWLQFIANFELYSDFLRHDPPVHFIPPDHPQRRLFEQLADAGMALRNDAIAPADRLAVLTLDEFNAMAKQYGVATASLDRRSMMEALAQQEAALVELAERYAPEDVFYLLPVGVDPHAVENEWQSLRAYSRLLLQLKEKIPDAH